MDRKTKSIYAYFVHDKNVPSTLITIGFKYTCNWFVLQKLIKGQPCMCLDLAYASENTCVAYSIYETIKEKLVGSPLEQSKSKVSFTKCNYQNGEFLITFSCPNNLTAVRKILTTAASKITPHKYYAKYSHNIKLLNAKPFKDEFIYSCNELKDVKLQIFMIGKLNTDKEKFNTMIDKVHNKFTPIKSADGAKKAYSLDKKQGVTDYPTSVSDGYKAVFVRDFIQSETGLPAVIHSGKVIVYNKKWNILSKKIKNKTVKKYTDQKYSKLGEKFIPVMLYMVSSECSLDTYNLIKLHKDNPSPNITASYIFASLQKN